MANITVFDPDGKRVLEVGPDGLATGSLAKEYMAIVETPAYESRRTVEQEGKLLTVFGPVSATEKARVFLADLAAAGYRVVP